MTHSGGKQHEVGDRGQRFEITAFDPSLSATFVVGWTECEKTARAMVAGLGAHPTWTDAKFTDRRIAA